ncbi:pyrroloquinoline quinone-dependent dehydrogenase [Novosphingobium sp. EMRT-2]|uniref:pyrroloquinoline quinone-dependent dehydrogenase n=1 Tax=Novosphingobium sp. EMRT-2 TaxID=2571749 RepID=UPI00143D1F3A|nr:pyrroloquinoline quinone-dependent dehydrogenase [Novosphingobium sp. EMRT-2]
MKGAGAVAALALAPGLAARGRPTRNAAEWPVYGATNAATKYSPLDQIDAANVATLEVAWEWTSPDAAILEAHPELQPGEFQATPIMVDGRLFTSTAMSQVAAIDPASGRTLWVYDPGTWRHGYPTSKGFQHRGVAFWRAGKDARVLIATGDNRLIALDAASGAPVAGFGEEGEVNLLRSSGEPVPDAPARLIGATSPPVICRDTVIVGQYINDVPSRPVMPVGVIQGFDVRSGRHKWTFRMIPRAGEAGAETWREGSAERTGNANAWAPMSADDDLGLVYVPGTCPTNNFFGGDRPGDNLFGNALVALDVETGLRRWHYQLVHHDIWDYDIPCAGNLVDIMVEGKRIPAIAQVTKQGFCFVFDRRDGKPVWPIEERPVPQSTIAGERTAATQPFPTKPPPFDRQGIGEDDLIDFTPALRDEARTILAKYKAGPLFTPLGTQPTIVLPSWVGGANWWGAAADPETGMLYVPSLTAPVSMALDGDGKRTDAADGDSEIAGRASVVRGPGGLPLLKPPYGRITAIDLHRGAIAWTRANAPRARDLPMFRPYSPGWIGTTSRTGPLLTRTLLFLGEGPHSPAQSRKMLCAYDKATGALRAEIPLPDHTLGPPMTYMADGRQFIVCGMGFRKAPHRLVALALPSTRKEP